MVRKSSDDAKAKKAKKAKAKAKAKSESSTRTTRGASKSTKDPKAPKASKSSKSAIIPRSPKSSKGTSEDLEFLYGVLAKAIETGKKLDANDAKIKKLKEQQQQLKEDASKNSKILAGVTPSHSEHGAVPENYGGRIARLEYCFFAICAYWVLGFFYSKILETYSA